MTTHQVDAQDFGVQADGAHDDGPSLQAAIDALPDSGGKVFLPAGRMRCGGSIRISRSYVTLEGMNCGLRSRLCEPDQQVGEGSLLLFDQDCDGIVIEAPPAPSEERPPRLGGITLRDFGISGTGKQNGRCGIIVRKGEGWTWGSTDALLLDRLYVIEYGWSARLATADMTVISACWFSECGNGLHLQDCVYNCVTNCCFADTDGIGVLVERGISSELTANVFVRNVRGLEIDSAQRIRVTGNCFETDKHTPGRDDLSLVRLRNNAKVVITGAVFFSQDKRFSFAIEADESSSVVTTGCMVEGEIGQLLGPGPDPSPNKSLERTR